MQARPIGLALRVSLACLAAVLTGAWTTHCFAQAAPPGFPSRPLKVVIGMQAGTGSDLSARFFCGQLAELIGQPCTVENKPGANGILAVQTVKQAPADGYTLILGSNSPMAVNPAILKNMGYDPLLDFKPIYGLTLHTNVMVVPITSAVHSVSELIETARGRRLNAGVYASLYELATYWLATVIGKDFLQVPYKGLPQLTVDMMGGQLDFAIVDLAGVAPLITSGKLRAIAVLGDRPHPEFPDVPTVKDSGYPEFVNYSWVALYLRSDVPPEITQRLVDAMEQIIKRPAARAYVAKMNLELMPLTPGAMRTFQIGEIERFKRIAAAAHLEPR